MNDLNRFDWIARSYDKLVSLVFGDTLQRAQLHFIHHIQEPCDLLILGGGTGKFLKALVHAKPFVHVVYIDASSEMIRLAKRQMSSAANITFIHGTQNEIPKIVFDVVICNFFFDLFQENEIEGVIKEILKNLKAGGRLYVTDFEKTDKLSHKLLLATMYLLFNISGSIKARRLPAWRKFLNENKLTLTHENHFCNGFISSSIFTTETR